MYPVGIWALVPSVSIELRFAFQIHSAEESSDGTDVEQFMHPVG